MKFNIGSWISAEILLILVLHSIAAVASFVRAWRDGLEFKESLRWGGIGFISGLLGLVARARMERRHVVAMLIVQDTLLNLGVEVIAIYGLPHLLV